MKNTSLKASFLAAVMSTFAIGAAAQTPNTQEQATAETMKMAMMQSCPMSIQGADLKLSDTSDGIQIAITARPGDVTELRRRVDAMAKMHSDPSKRPMIQGKMMAFTVKNEEISSGARLTLTPTNHVQLSEFRTEVRKHAELMKKGDCSMMQGMMGNMMGGMKTTDTTPKVDESDHSDHHPSGDGK